jgi:uncharacterized protein YndB with AHSA1/START domain
LPAERAETSAIEREVRVEAEPEVVFPFFTDPEKMLRWIGTEATLDPRPGGIFRVNVSGRDVVRGEFVEVVPCERVIFTWGWEGEVFPVPPGSSVVEVLLRPDGNGTVVQVRHSELPEAMRSFHGFGWEHSLGRLVVAAAGGDPGRDPLTSFLRATLMSVGHLPLRYYPRTLWKSLRSGRPAADEGREGESREHTAQS